MRSLLAGLLFVLSVLSVGCEKAPPTTTDSVPEVKPDSVEAKMKNGETISQTTATLPGHEAPRKTK